MQRAEIELEDEHYAALERRARDRGRAVSDLLHEAVSGYLQRQEQLDAARAQMKSLLAAVHGRIPPHVTPEEIEAHIAAAREEWRQERRAARERDDHERS